MPILNGNKCGYALFATLDEETYFQMPSNIKERTCRSHFFLQDLISIKKGDRNKNERFTYPESVPEQLKNLICVLLLLLRYCYIIHT